MTRSNFDWACDGTGEAAMPGAKNDQPPMKVPNTTHRIAFGVSSGWPIKRGSHLFGSPCHECSRCVFALFGSCRPAVCSPLLGAPYHRPDRIGRTARHPGARKEPHGQKLGRTEERIGDGWEAYSPEHVASALWEVVPNLRQAYGDCSAERQPFAQLDGPRAERGCCPGLQRMASILSVSCIAEPLRKTNAIRAAAKRGLRTSTVAAKRIILFQLHKER
jgi:hypothetical protein